MKFTVVLLRPDYMCDDVPYGQDTYIGFVEANTIENAIKRARNEVLIADRQCDNAAPHTKPTDYAVNLVFEGHQQPRLFGWQLQHA